MRAGSTKQSRLKSCLHTRLPKTLVVRLNSREQGKEKTKSVFRGLTMFNSDLHIKNVNGILKEVRALLIISVARTPCKPVSHKTGSCTLL